MVGPSASILSWCLRLRVSSVAVPPQRLDLVVDLLERAGGAADQDQVRAFPGVGAGHRPADAARGPGDEGETAGKALVACSMATRLAPACRPGKGQTRRVDTMARRGAVSIQACSHPAGLTPPQRQFFFGALGLGFVHQLLGRLQGVVVGLLRRFLALVDSRAWRPRRRARSPAWPARPSPWPSRAPCRCRAWPSRAPARWPPAPSRC